MENLYISGKLNDHIIPTVDFNAKTGICEISGESYLEETYEFYDGLCKWLEKYTQEVKNPITFIIKLSYFNTSSSKCILTLLTILKKYQFAGGIVNVNWHIEEGDEDVLEEIEDFSIDTGLTINCIPLE